MDLLGERGKGQSGPSDIDSGRLSSLVAGELRLELLHHARLAQRRHVSQLAALGDVAEQSAHDLARARLWHVGGPDDPPRPRELADPPRDLVVDLALERLVAVVALALEDHERADRLARVLVGH